MSRGTGLVILCLLLISWNEGSQKVGAQGVSRTLVPAVAQRAPADIETPPPPSSQELIEAARQAGTISAADALLYRMYAASGDERLPTRFRGWPAEDEAIYLEVIEGWLTLPIATQAILTPFFLPPAAPGSYYHQRRPRATTDGSRRQAIPCPSPYPGWSCVVGQQTKVFWDDRAPGHAADAARVLAEFEATIWPALTGLMGREPVGDTAFAPNDGGDGKVDIYLVADFAGYTPGRASRYFDPARELGRDPCPAGPAFITLDPGFALPDGADLFDVLAHEFFHVLQYSYGMHVCRSLEYHWLREATAVWAESYVYPKIGSPKWNWRSANFLPYVDSPLNGATPSGKGYGVWLIPLHLSKSAGPGAIRALFEATTRLDSLGALDSVAPGGLLQYWPRVVLDLWNAPPVDPFRAWQGMTLQPKTATGSGQRTSQSADLAGASQGIIRLPVTGLPYLSVRYFHFTFREETSRSIRVTNPFVEQTEIAATVHALIKIEGRPWVVEDWTAEREKRFCRDTRDERLEELVVVVGNRSWSDVGYGGKRDLAPPEEPALHVTNIGCWRWTGTVSATFDANDPSSRNRRDTETLSTQVTFERTQDVPGWWTNGGTVFRVIPTNSGKDGQPSFVSWQILGGSIDVPELSATNCEIQGTSAVVPLDSERTQPRDWAYLAIWNFATEAKRGARPREYEAEGAHGQSLGWKDKCLVPQPDGTLREQIVDDGKGFNYWLISEWFGNRVLTVQPDGATIVGAFSTTFQPGQMWVLGRATYRWEFRAVRE